MSVHMQQNLSLPGGEAKGEMARSYFRCLHQLDCRRMQQLDCLGSVL